MPKKITEIERKSRTEEWTERTPAEKAWITKWKNKIAELMEENSKLRNENRRLKHSSSKNK